MQEATGSNPVFSTNFTKPLLIKGFIPKQSISKAAYRPSHYRYRFCRLAKKLTVMRKKICVPTLYPLNRDLAKTWFVKYYSPAGKPVKLYGKLAWYHTVKEKEAEGARIIAEILTPGTIAEKRRTDLTALLGEMLEYKRPALELKSYQSYFSILKGFTLWYRAATKKGAVPPGEYARHMQLQGFHKNTVRNRITVLRGLAIEKKITPNPFDGIKVKKTKGTSKLPFTAAQIDLIKKEISTGDAQLWLAIQFMYYLFLRPKELRLLKIGDILFSDNKLILPGTVAKDDDTILKAVPMPLRPALAALSCYPAHYFIFSKQGMPGAAALGVNYLSNRATLYLRKLNFSHRYTFYSFCHTGIKNAALCGIPIKQLQLQKGHADLKMFDEYLKDLGINDCTQLVTDFPAL